MTLFIFISSPGESIPICALIENCSSRLVVPKAVMYQIQTYTAKGKTKSIKQVVASSRGNVVPPDTSSRWNGNSLKIPPVSPSILNSDIMRVEYVLAVSKNCMLIIWFSFFIIHYATRLYFLTNVVVMKHVDLLTSNAIFLTSYIYKTPLCEWLYLCCFFV